MPFGVVNGVSRGMGVLDRVEIVEGEEVVMAHYGVNVDRPIITSGDFVA